MHIWAASVAWQVTARRRRYPDTLIPDNREMYKLSLVSLQNQMVLYKKGRPVSWIRGINNLAIKASSLEYDLTVPDSCYLICKQLNLSQWDSNLEPIFHLAAETGWSGCPGQHHNTSSPHHPSAPGYSYPRTITLLRPHFTLIQQDSIKKYYKWISLYISHAKPWRAFLSGYLVLVLSLGFWEVCST